jgi:hypothetical protein
MKRSLFGTKVKGSIHKTRCTVLVQANRDENRFADFYANHLSIIDDPQIRNENSDGFSWELIIIVEDSNHK